MKKRKGQQAETRYVDRRKVEALLAKDKRRPVKFEVLYPGRGETPITYDNIGQINFDTAYRITVLFPENTRFIFIGNGEGYVSAHRKRVK